jgi:hypothetical protein
MIDTDADRMRHFHALDRAEQAAAIRRLAAGGMTENGISHATALNVEFVKRVLSVRAEHDHDHVDIATAATEWAIEHLERANWSPQEIQTHLARLLDPEPIGGNA